MVLQSFRIRAGSGSVSCVRSTNRVPQSYHIDAYPPPRRVQFGVDVSIRVQVALRLRSALRVRIGFVEDVVVVDVPGTHDVVVVDVFQYPVVVCHFFSRIAAPLRCERYTPIYDDIAKDSAVHAHANSDMTLLSTWTAVPGGQTGHGRRFAYDAIVIDSQGG